MLEEQNKQVRDFQTENNNRKNSVLKGFMITVAAGMVGSFLTLTIAPQIGQVMDNEETVATIQETNSSDTAVNVQQVSTSTASLADIIEQSSKAIVGITNIQIGGSNSYPGFYQNQGASSQEVESGTGSGVVYKVTDDAMYIVTNNHVIEDATKIQVSLYNEEVMTAELVGTDSLSDIAVLKVNGNYDITPLSFGDSDNLRAGDEVIAIGNPLGLDFYGTVTQGIISAVNRNIAVSTSAGIWEMDVIQTDAAINPGNSGGALINTYGELIGINSMKIADDDVEGLGFAIPSNKVENIIEELTENGQVVRPYLGLSMANLSEVPQFNPNQITDNHSEGVIITDIDETGPSARAGLISGDVIVSINGEKVTDADDLRKYLYSELSVGDSVKMEYYRQGELESILVTLGSSQQ
ncbi:S1C family serine protease [Paucisalibacillus globulus]|uniref:S1C family serine protease n=1 Tax=Paucisalibacillus globulus TaxID=351095 RepID=UPI00041001EB|nr:trypsin-like peptidase domain-containing protein [Paucisalibacillus globulus]